jgi:DNA (cytosine-5)-methyltransferase 1
MSYVCAELCTGAGGAALGLEMAGFEHGALIERSGDCCATLRANRPGWPVYQADITKGSLTGSYDLLSAGLPCTPHSRGGKQLGTDDERHLWSAALDITGQVMPRAVLTETADAVLGPKFAGERARTRAALTRMGYTLFWEVLDALWYGVPQRRRRAVLVAFREPAAASAFRWPAPVPEPPPSVGQALYKRMSARGWPGADAWRDAADGWAPTIVGGSEKHGGADLGPSQAKNAWRKLGINPLGVADDVPDETGKYPRGEKQVFDAADAGPMLTIRCGALLQGFPEDWSFHGGKTSRWRQIGNAFPPPAARAIGTAIRTALEAADERKAS